MNTLPPQLSRRAYLRNAAMAMFGLGTAPLWLQRATAASSARPGKVLVNVFLRGAMDGLNAVAPYGEKQYRELRPNLALPSPGQEGGLLRLDDLFGLHPALQPLQALYADQQLAIVHAAGSPDPTRSHFDAQDYMESGTPGRKATRDGWLNRTLAGGASGSPVRAVALQPSLPRSLRGLQPAVAVQSIGNFNVKQKAGMAFAEMYAQSADAALQETSKATFAAVQLLEGLRNQGYQPANGSRYPNSRFGNSLQQIAQMIKAGVGLEVAFTDITGWDTHINQAPALQDLLQDLAAGLQAFGQDLGPARMSDVLVVTMSEFGRTARENGNRGTDHGHANAMFLYGGNVKGGKVYGPWPGLQEQQLYQGRDLAVTTDFRDVLATVTARHLGNPKVEQVFPGYTPQLLPLL